MQSYDTITDVTIILYRAISDSEEGAYGNHGCRLYIVTEQWDEQTVTRNTQPAHDGCLPRYSGQ